MRGSLAAAASLCAIVAALSCRAERGTTLPLLVETEKGRFPHAKHTTTTCITCHSVSAVLSGKPARPGANDHAPCDRNQCHKAEFLKPPGDFCKMCHSAVGVALGGVTSPAPYPPIKGPRAMASNFSHAKHLDYALMEKRVGFHVSCTDCHKLGDRGLTRPGHKVCARCHAREAAPTRAPSLRDCAACHSPKTKKPTRLRTLIRGDLRFAHKRHRTDRRGKIVLCTTCHKNTKRVRQTAKHSAPATATCVGCHDDETRVPQSRRMRVCETCHTTRARTIGSIAPRSHLPTPDRPIDHTIAFRKDHATDARKDSARCAKCHTFMSGSKRSSCDDCHQVMRPKNHVVTWREFEHGPAAATRADVCATCHAGDFCTSCHSKPPRSHMPLTSWRMGGHGAQAAFNMRPCITCHTVARDCSRCHRVRRP